MDESERLSLEEWDDKYLWHPFTPHSVYRQEEPLLFVRGDGLYLIDAKGDRYLDAVSSIWCSALGHRHPTIDAAIKAQLEKLGHATMLGNATEPAIRLGRELIERLPDPLSRVFYSDNGSTAVEIALKMAYQFRQNSDDPRQHKKKKFLAFTHGYNGDTIGSVSVGGVDLYHDRFRALLFDVIRAPSPYSYRRPEGMTAEEAAQASLETTLKLIRAHADELTGVIVEPGAQGAGGIITYPDNWLPELRRITQEADIFLIADEVATGFGRGGHLMACEADGVVPDFLCFSKMLTGGYLPMSTTITTERVFEGFLAAPSEGKTFFHGHTYTGNPLAAAAALAVLKVFDEEGTLDHVKEMAARLNSRLQKLWEHPWVGDIRTWGLAAGIELVADKSTKEPFNSDARVGMRVAKRMRDKGVFVRPLQDVMVLMPPLNIDADNLDLVVDALSWALDEELRLQRGEAE